MKALRPLTASLMLLTSCLLISNTTLAKTTLKLSHNQDKSHAVHKALSYLADKTKEYSNGELVIRIYPNATLGNERESLELMNSGALQMVKVNAASLESFAPDYSLFSLPFLFRDRDQSPSAIAMMKALGGVATPMAQGELYTALQQGVVDGGENNTVVYADMRHAEVAKVYSRDEHTMVPDVLIISTDVLNKLGDKERTALLKAADESMMQMKDVIWPAAEKEAYDKMKGMNATVVDVDKSAFKERVKPLYDEFKAKDAQSAKNLELVESM